MNRNNELLLVTREFFPKETLKVNQFGMKMERLNENIPIITQFNLSVEDRNSNPELNTSVAAETSGHPDVLLFQNLNTTLICKFI